MKCDKCSGEFTPKRTSSQNNALHLFCSQLAEQLNLNGLTMQEVMSEMAEVDWSTNSVKENIWKRMQKLVLAKDSTTDLNKSEEIDLVYDHINRWFAKNPKVQATEFEMPPFPSAELLEQIDSTFTSNKGPR